MVPTIPWTACEAVGEHWQESLSRLTRSRWRFTGEDLCFFTFNIFKQNTGSEFVVPNDG